MPGRPKRPAHRSKDEPIEDARVVKDARGRVLVVGTTGDYVDWIVRQTQIRSCAWPVLFLTDAAKRAAAKEPAPGVRDEIVADLSDHAAAIDLLAAHLCRWDIALSGITSYDCESLQLAAEIAARYGLPYPSVAAVTASRSKAASKRLWKTAGIACPQAALVRSARDIAAFFEANGGPAVLKPLSGSGSELIFRCNDLEEARRALEVLTERLSKHPDVRMYTLQNDAGESLDPRRVFVIETFISGDEYSCDAILENGAARMMRLSRKIVHGEPVGTAIAYEVPGRLPHGLDRSRLLRVISAAARALGLTRAIIMVDFIVREGEPVLLEMTPRPGGDCIPPLVRRSTGLDTILAAIDFAAGKDLDIPPAASWRRMVGLRLIAPMSGTITGYDTRRLASDRRVQEIAVRREIGHRVHLPPADYDSRILGHVIFAPEMSRQDLARECEDIAALFELEIDGRQVGPRFCRVSS